MLNATRIRDAGAAGHYYAQVDDYYRENDLAPSLWQGHGAELLGLEGDVDPDEFTRILDAYLPDGTILSHGGSTGQRRAGTDLTFQADKSVSILALVGSPDVAEAATRAHERAVGAALDLLEAHAGTRVRAGDFVSPVTTGNLVVARFRHDTNRAQEPHLHTHAIVANATRTRDGQWRALNTDSLQEHLADASQLYQTTLAQELERAGIAVERERIRGLTIAKAAGVSRELQDHFSTRAKDVEEALAKRGLTRETATREQRETAALETRRAKEALDHTELRDQWRAETHALGMSDQTEGERRDRPERSPEEQAVVAQDLVRDSMAHLGERDARFTARALRRDARGRAIGTGVSVDGIDRAIESLERSGELRRRHVDHYDRTQRATVRVGGFTTRAAVVAERQAINAERAGRGRAHALSDARGADRAVERAEAGGEYEWTQSQRESTRGLLTDDNRVTGIQGYAGTAKTTTVLRTVAAEAQARGLEVVGLAPTATAVDQLRDGAGLDESRTVASYLAGASAEDSGGRPRLVVVDEASLLSSRDMARLLSVTEKRRDRVVLVGDVRQLGSVEAGEAFRQLQDAGMRTYKLDEIVRQRTAGMREAVVGVLARDASRALDALSSQKAGGIVEVSEESAGGARTDRLRRMADDYLSLTPRERERTIVIDPTRAGRARLNRMIRDGLRRDGTLGRTEVRAASLERKDMTRVEARDIASYRPGDAVVFARDRRRDGVRAGEVYTVREVDRTRRELVIGDRNGNTARIRPERIGDGKMQTYSRERMPLREGERVQWTRNDRERGLKNGDVGRVTRVREDGTANVRFGKRTVTLDLARPQTIRYGYAQTLHAAQGRTADRVLAHTESYRTGLLDNRSMYVAISRARQGATLYTDDRAALRSAIEDRSGDRARALEGRGERVERERGTERKREAESRDRDHEHGGPEM